MKTISVFALFLLVRLCSVLLVDTWYVPDEYWQSLEVAHRFVYGYGHLTWEWTTGIRSYIHPLIISVIYKLLNIVGLDSANALIYLPRVLQALLTAYSDLCFWRWSGCTKWSIFCIASSWFWFYTGSRTLLNTVETCLTTIALSQYPFKTAAHTNNHHFVWLIGLMTAMRPTAILVWLPLILYNAVTAKEGFLRVSLRVYLPIGSITILASCAVDSFAHGSFVVTWWEFLKMNVFNGVGEWYGSQPWHWYMSQGLPAILGVQLLPFLAASVHILKHRTVFIDELVLLATMTFTVGVYSCLGHKEFRFLLPLLPIALHITAKYLSNWSRKANDIFVWIVAGFILIGNAVPAVYLGLYHQRGTLDVMTPLRQIATANPESTTLLFLMPCHSTPLYSHLHQNVTARFLTCNPNLSKVEEYVDEADHFYRAPGAWLRNNYPPTKPLPSHIIAFDNLVPHLSDILNKYRPIHRLYHTSVGQADARIGRFVTVHELID